MQRGSELVALQLEDIQVTGKRIVVCIQKVKNDQLSRGSKVYIDATGSAVCLVRLLQQWLAVQGRQPGLLFTNVSGQPLSTSAISSICQRMVAVAGQKELVMLHSLRIGGATAVVEGSLMCEQTMTIGGWNSGAVDRYLRAQELAMVGVSRRMGL
jgi:site-specific recombinase XerD